MKKVKMIFYTVYSKNSVGASIYSRIIFHEIIKIDDRRGCWINRRLTTVVFQLRVNKQNQIKADMTED